MAVLVFAENWDGKFKKATFEAASYAAQVAEQMSVDAVAVSVGKIDDDELKKLGQYGITKVLKADQDDLQEFRPHMYGQAVAQAAELVHSGLVVFANTFNGRSLASRVGTKLNAGTVTGVVALPEVGDTFTVRKPVFSGKGFAKVEITSDRKVVSLLPNSVTPVEKPVDAQVESFDPSIDTSVARTEIRDTTRTTDKRSLTEAERVVSGGRGMKGPENWNLIEQLANELEAATACSKPVSDMEWRPHSEHVGQTGLTIRPNLYVAVGISGAIQHLAGVNASKVIAVINKDPEAPFFKAADYGIVGDAFEVLPKLIEAAKKLNAES